MNKAGTTDALEAMLDYWRGKYQPGVANVGFAEDPQADKLVREDLFAFLLACSIDRMGKSTLIWNIPYKLKLDWGHLDPSKISRMSPEELASNQIIAHAPGLVSREQIAKTIISLAQVVTDDYDGHPERMLDGSISDIMDKLQQVSGIGPNIARMIIIIRILYFGLKPARTGRLLPKIDVHVTRVMIRTGTVPDGSERSLLQVLRHYPIEDIAAIDQVCWEVGQTYCKPHKPDCRACFLNECCAKVGVSQ
ncbi:MAG: hypothetical protein QME62_09045 [Armatimonadota bacterium]|nr:hypothetical protein [Armatimonadota bacterium]